jgi:hemerythrin-like metal-binding protein
MSVGVGKIDKEHQGLFDLMNQLHDGMLSGRGKDVLGPVLGNLMQYTKVHFGNEETLLRLHSYPQLADHMKYHEVFRKKVGDLDTQFKSGTAALSVSTLEFLRDWLSKHILGVDAQYKAFLAAKGVK